MADIDRNSTVRNCQTCAHRDGRLCCLTGYSWELQRQLPSSACDVRLSGWHPIPPSKPRRSLRRWLLDLFWN